MKPWRTLHLDIDGVIHDRESGEPDLELEMMPIGTELPLDQQSRELKITINGTSTILDEEGIADLVAFLEMRP